jgi:septal ring factor EnvC (AmiA/AmiB activator)
LLEGGKDMSRDGFASGFLTGALVGGIVGGLLGAVLANRRDALFSGEEEQEAAINSAAAKKDATRRQMKAAANDSLEIETARRSLEDKIAQLNATIDDVRKQLGNVNGNIPQTTSERSVSQDS